MNPFFAGLPTLAAGFPALRAAQRAFMLAASFARPSEVRPLVFFALRGFLAGFAVAENFEAPFLANRPGETFLVIAFPVVLNQTAMLPGLACKSREVL